MLDVLTQFGETIVGFWPSWSISPLDIPLMTRQGACVKLEFLEPDDLITAIDALVGAVKFTGSAGHLLNRRAGTCA
ncbi:hypothetical protein [Streptomyces sp. NBC_00996]|uniref:hypothetical protein n=1 Tax=Streptomyces sp. NBC_00996 TaxID=2903710 RepID=UPI0038676A5F|nr:hypothetical protein OG390_42605 [Streptomyces sp. NBC_00996]